jgi:hypothetical protein
MDDGASCIFAGGHRAKVNLNASGAAQTSIVRDGQKSSVNLAGAGSRGQFLRKDDWRGVILAEQQRPRHTLFSVLAYTRFAHERQR